MSASDGPFTWLNVLIGGTSFTADRDENLMNRIAAAEPGEAISMSRREVELIGDVSLRNRMLANAPLDYSSGEPVYHMYKCPRLERSAQAFELNGPWPGFDIQHYLRPRPEETEAQTVSFAGPPDQWNKQYDAQQERPSDQSVIDYDVQNCRLRGLDYWLNWSNSRPPPNSISSGVAEIRKALSEYKMSPPIRRRPSRLRRLATWLRSKWPPAFLVHWKQNRDWKRRNREYDERIVAAIVSGLTAR